MKLTLSAFIIELVTDAAQELRGTPEAAAIEALLGVPAGARRRAQLKKPTNRRRPNPAYRAPAPPPEPPAAAAPSIHDQVLAAIILSRHSGLDPEAIVQDADTRKKAFKTAAAKLHPDNASTGDREAFQRVVWAKEVWEPKEAQQ